MKTSAVLSPDGRYRYRLTRAWADGAVCVFVMLNPSTADADHDDPTIRRCVDFARRWACGALEVVNLYAWRATKPAALWHASDPVGPENDRHLTEVAALARATGGPLVAAWGAHALPDRVADVLTLPGMRELSALALTKAGGPRHPLYLPRTLTPAPWSPPTLETA